MCLMYVLIFLFKQKTAYEMRISDWSSDVCSSDLLIFPRNPDGTFQLPALLQSSLNFAAQRAKGLDVDVAYNHRFDADNRLVLRFVGNWVRERTDFPYIDDPSQPERLKGELGDPIYAFNFSADYTYKQFTLGYELRYIGRKSLTDWEAKHETYGVRSEARLGGK